MIVSSEIGAHVNAVRTTINLSPNHRTSTIVRARGRAVLLASRPARARARGAAGSAGPAPSAGMRCGKPARSAVYCVGYFVTHVFAISLFSLSDTPHTVVSRVESRLTSRSVPRTPNFGFSQNPIGWINGQ
eukprot:2971655-Prymnesium_polylepis.1